MAILSFQINGAQYFSNQVDACNSSIDGTSRYFDDLGGTLTEPIVGSAIFIDAAGTQFDTFLEDGVTPKSPGIQYWYTTDFGRSILVNDNGKLVADYICPSSSGVDTGILSLDPIEACLNNAYDSTKYSQSNPSATGATIIIGDNLFDDAGFSSPTADGFYFLYGQTEYIQISSGIVVKKDFCNLGSNNIILSNPNPSKSTACVDSTQFQYFSADSPINIILGSKIFEDPNLINPFDGGLNWYFLHSTGKSIRIDANGIVIEIFTCVGTSIWEVYSLDIVASTNHSSICDGTATNSIVYYASDNGPLTIKEIGFADLPIYRTFAGANIFADEMNNGLPLSYTDVFPNAFFKTLTLPGIWYLKWNGDLRTWPLLGNDEQCVTITYQVFSIALTHDINNEAITASDFCSSTQTSTTYYYLADDTTSYELLDLAIYNIPIYKTYNAALDQLSTGLAEKQIYLQNIADGWFYFGDGVPSGRRWFGFDTIGHLATGDDIVIGGNCIAYVRPTTLVPEIITSNDPFASSYFYAFWSCDAIEATPGNVQWNMYVVDGAHFIGETNHMTDFIDTMHNTLKYTFKIPTDECVTYTHTIIANDIIEAESLLEAAGYNSMPPNNIYSTTVLQSLATSLGIYSNNTISLKQDCSVCDDPTADTFLYTFGDIEGGDFDPTLGPNFATEKNYELDNVARPLLRTNPKLTTNIKLIADTSDNIYLESINATKDLASIEYKRNEVNPNGSYSYDIANFFNSKRTPYDIAYQTKRTYSDVSVLEDYQSQIEEDYQYGATINYSKLYDEKFRIFAPIWADLNMPKLFVIFKINNPKTSANLADTAAGNLTRIKSILSNAEIVKTFDLTKNSSLGKYIRNHVQDERFPATPLTFSFEKNEKSSYNGIDLVKGGFTSKAEYLYKDLVEKDKPLIEANDFITDGFRRNSLVSANILNIEFLFDDPNAVDYSVSRYFGLYVDAIDSGIGEVSTSNYGKIKFKSVESYVAPSIPSSGIPSNKMMNNNPTLGYVSIEDSYYKISTNKYYDELNLNLEVVDKNNDIFDSLGIKYTNKSIDIKTYDSVGYDFIKLKVIDIPVVNDNIAITATKEEVFSFKFIKHVPNTNVEISDIHGHSFVFNTGIDTTQAITNFKLAFASSTINNHFVLTQTGLELYATERKAGLGNLNLYVSISNGNIIKVKNAYTHVNLYDNTVFAAAPGELGKGLFSNNKFSQDGSLSDIAIAMAACINQSSDFTAFNSGEYVYIKTNIPGYRILQHTLLVNKNNNSDFVDVENPDPTGNIIGLDNEIISNWDAYYFKGGNSKNKAILVTENTADEIKILDYIATKYSNKFNKIIDVVEHIEDLNAGYYKVILTDENSISSGDTRLYRENRLRIGLFSAYDIYDLNFDFYDTSNSDLKELKKEEYTNIQYEPYTVTKSIEDSGLTPNGLNTDEILNEAYSLSPIEYFSNLLPILENETISGLASKFISSEFDRLQENNTKELALNSRVVPNINKWVLNNTLTTREQPYYLNANEAFGRTNFAPDLTVEGRDRKSFTHEWFYMDKLPTFYRYNHISDTFSYVNFIQDFELTKDLFMDVTNDYFDKFMISDGLEVSSNYLDLSSSERRSDSTEFNMNTFVKKDRVKKYTLVENGNDIGFASTFFKGIKVLFKSRKEFDSLNPTEYVKNTEFNGYKFSTLVKINQDSSLDGSNSIEYDVIQNKAHKFIIFYITLNISDFWLDGSLSRKMLYELNHKMVYDLATDSYIYSDVNLSGALDLLGVDFSQPGPYAVSGITHINGGEPQFETQIATGADDLYGRILMDFGTGTIYASRVQTINSNNEVVLLERPYDITDPNNLLPVAYLNMSLQIGATYIYEGGGVNSHSKLLEKLSIQYVADLLNNNNNNITYKTVEADGTILENRFVINFEGGKEIIKNANLKIEEDTEKPKSFKLNSGTIGYNIVQGNSYYPFLIRHSGNYTVDMRPVITFTDLYTHFKVNRDHMSGNATEREFEEGLYKHSLTSISEVTIARNYYNRYNRTGTTFNLGFIQDDGTHDKDWGLIKNHFYHKVNDINNKGVTKLSISSELAPLYPLISEIAIDKKDVNVFRSSWDSNYYTRSLAGGKSINVPGTFDVIEERSYLASTMMTLEDSYILLNYTTANVNSKEKLDEILRNSNNTADVMIFEDENNVIADFYMDSIIYTKLRDAGVLSTLSDYILPENSFGDKTTLIDDAQNYIIKNLLNVFTVDNLLLYTKPFKGKASSIVNSNSTLELESNGFDKDNNFTYVPHAQTPLNFRLIYNKRLGYSYDIKPMIKIKS